MTLLHASLREHHFKRLVNHFFSKHYPKEGAAFLLFSQAQAHDRCREINSRIFLLVDAQLLSPEELVSSSDGHITWDNSKLFPFLKRALADNLVVGIAHSHIDYPAVFSVVDDEGERGLIELVAHRNGPNAELLSFVFSSHGDIQARLWSREGSESIAKINVVGDQWQFRTAGPNNRLRNQALSRQALAFGEELNHILNDLRITVVGCGGTGSAVAMLLARLGVGILNLIDPDVVEVTNLNRLHGASMNDAQSKRKKVDIVSNVIESIGLGTSVCKYASSVMDPECYDALKSSDVIFGCTDDNSGRLLLNRFAYFYLVPVIDLGLAIEVTRDEKPRVLALDGRVTVLIPETTCLLCRGVVDTERARAESLKARNPGEYTRQKGEAYVVGEGNPNPSVVTFTTEVATMAVNELLHRILGFRGPDGATAQRTRQFHRMHDLRPGDLPKEDCPICGSEYYWGKGDLDPFLDQVW